MWEDSPVSSNACSSNVCSQPIRCSPLESCAFVHRFPSADCCPRAPRVSHLFDSFYAAQDIAVGEELSFDYGIEYWVFRDMQPLNDSRGLQIALRRAVRYIGAFAQALKAARFGLPL